MLSYYLIINLAECLIDCFSCSLINALFALCVTLSIISSLSFLIDLILLHAHDLRSLDSFPFCWEISSV